MIRIGLLGCGNVGHIIAKYKGNFEIVALFDKVKDHAAKLASEVGVAPSDDFSSFISGDFDIVVEAASVEAVMYYGKEILLHGKDLVVMSVGALSDSQFLNELVETARSHERRIHVPSGAIFGLDNLKIGKISEISRLLLRTTKSPASLDLKPTERKLIFSGKAHECIRGFPKNTNVSVAISLATGQEADVELYVDPSVDRNVHEIFVEGEFGDAYIRIRNVRSPDNPATSYLAALSILTLLESIDNPLVVGT